jgi:hypothetical protein
MAMKVRVLDTLCYETDGEFRLINLAAFPDATEGDYAEIPRSLFTALNKARNEYEDRIYEIRRLVDAQKQK